VSKILIIYSSQTGHTGKMAEAVAEGSRMIEQTEVIMKKARDATLDDLLAADGVAFGTPENFGYMSGMLKDFFDRTYADAQDKVFRKPYVVFISAGNDGTGALRAIERIALGYKFKNIFTPVIARGKSPLRFLISAGNWAARLPAAAHWEFTDRWMPLRLRR
jgi:multimeric flavodoxin WrbA